jgi:hypothetical protein
MWKYWSSCVKLCVGKGLNFGPNDWILHHDKAPVHKVLSVSGPKIDYLHGTLMLFLWFGSKWLLAVSKNTVYLKETKISGYQSHPTKCDDGTESYSITGVPKIFPTMVASLGYVHSCSRGVLWRWPISVSCKYRGTTAVKSFWEFIVMPHNSNLGSRSRWVVSFNSPAILPLEKEFPLSNG